jgi:hypothetical protein
MSITRRQFTVGSAAALAGSAAGAELPSEMKTSVDPETQRTVRQLTSARANSYPLYYFTPSITADSRYLVFHSERSGWVQLYRMDLETGRMAQLTDGHTRDAGWAVWCEPHLRGIFNHISSLSQTRREVFYFQDEQVRRVHVETLANRVVCELPGRIPIGQSDFSPDGRYFSFVHADRVQFRQAFSDRESTLNMGLPFNHIAWRNSIPTVIGLIDTETGAYRDVVKLDYHVHHVVFADNRRLLVNHPKGDSGMWVVNLDGSGIRTLRPRDGHGSINHQVVTKRGIFYEAVHKQDGRTTNWLGRYDLATDKWEEVQLPDDGYVHTGWDPDGRFLFYETHGKTHELISLHYPRVPGRTTTKVLRRLALYPAKGGQRYHAHPFLSPDRRWLFHTAVVDGFSQVSAIDVRDLVDVDEYWDRRA